MMVISAELPRRYSRLAKTGEENDEIVIGEDRAPFVTYLDIDIAMR
jgi:hypothetical protein